MERYLVELNGDQVELLSGMVREAIQVADEKKVPALEALLSALGIMSWKEPEIAGPTESHFLFAPVPAPLSHHPASWTSTRRG
jgi:hypothetical protein